MKKPQQPLGIVFDFDGVLLNSLYVIYQAIMGVFRDHGIPVLTFAKFMEDYEAPYLNYYRRHGITASKDEIQSCYTGHYMTQERPVLFPETPSCVQQLAEAGYALGIISASSGATLREYLDPAGLTGHFASIHGGCHHKVATLQGIMDTHGLTPERTVFVGDMKSDIRDGKAAGVITVNFCPFYAIYSRRPDHYANSHDALVKLVDQL